MVHSEKQYKGEVHNYSFDFSLTAKNLNSSVLSAVWSSEDNSIASLSSDSLSNDIASVLVDAKNSGRCIITVLATMSNGQKFAGKIKIMVSDPVCSYAVSKW